MLIYLKAIIRSTEAFDNPSNTNSNKSSNKSEDDLSNIDNNTNF